MIKYLDKINIPEGAVFFYDLFGLASHSLDGLARMLEKEENHDWYDITVIIPDGKIIPLDGELKSEASDIYDFQRKVECASRCRRIILSGNLDEVFIEICSIYPNKYGGPELNYSFDLGYMYGDYPEYSDGEHVKIPYNSWWSPDYCEDTEHAIVLRKADYRNVYPRPIYKDGFIGYFVCPSNESGDILEEPYTNLMTFPTALLRKIL